MALLGQYGGCLWDLCAQAFVHSCPHFLATMCACWEDCKKKDGSMFEMSLVFSLCSKESWVPMSVHLINTVHGLITDKEVKGDDANDPI